MQSETRHMRRRRIRFLTALALATCLGVGLARAAELTPTDFARRMKITFEGYDNGGSMETLTNFPVLVKLTDYDGFIDTADGFDLRFKNATLSSNLNYEIESWGYPASTSFVWVCVPELTNGTTIYATWGNSAESNQYASTTNGSVWVNGFEAVWHMSETSGSTTYDSTTNDNDGDLVDTPTLGEISQSEVWDPPCHNMPNPAKVLRLLTHAQQCPGVDAVCDFWGHRGPYLPHANLAAMAAWLDQPEEAHAELLRRAAMAHYGLAPEQDDLIKQALQAWDCFNSAVDDWTLIGSQGRIFAASAAYADRNAPMLRALILEEIEARRRQLELSAAIGAGGGIDPVAVSEDIQNMMLFLSSPDFPGTCDDVFAPVSGAL